jgi:hypothetical protein
VQAAVQQLLAIEEKWSAYGTVRFQASEDDRPTDVANSWYSLGDMITVAVILKRPDPEGTTLADYGYREQDGRKSVSHSFVIWPCAGLRTGNGQVCAHVLAGATKPDGQPGALQLSFPRLIDGKPLISNDHE